MNQELIQSLMLFHGRLPYYRGKWWVAEQSLERLPVLSKFHGRICRDGLLLDVDCRHCVVDRQLAYFGCYERNELKAVRELIRPGSVVLDVGSNIGYMALQFGRMVGPTGEVHAFEPFPDTFKRLEGHLSLNGMQWINPWQVALTDKVGQASGVRDGFVGCSHLTREGEQAADKVEFSTTTIDEFVNARKLKSIDFIKIDVEGAEMAVLTGGEETIRKYKPAMMIEFNHPQELPARLRDWGYSLFIAGRKGLKLFDTATWKRGVAESNLFAVP